MPSIAHHQPKAVEDALLNLVTEMRQQLSSQQRQINELSKHTQGEIIRLWQTLSSAGVPAAGAAAGAARPMPQQHAAGGARAAVGALAGTQPSNGAIVQQLYAVGLLRLVSTMGFFAAHRCSSGFSHS